MADGTASKTSDSRRNFLKIGAGFAVGAVVAGVGVAAYDGSVIGSNNSSSSSAVASLQDELAATQSQLSDTQDSLSAASGTVSSLNDQLANAQSALGSAQSSLSTATSQNSNLTSQLSATQQSLNNANSQVASLQSTVSGQSSTISGLQNQVASATSQVTALQGQVTSANAQVSSLQGQVTSAQNQAVSLQDSLDTVTAYQTLGTDEVTLLQAITSVIIPTDSNGPGANTAGVLYFIDGQLAGKYGWCGQMYMQGPFLPSGITSPVTVNGVTYSGGTMSAILDGGQRYQYDMNLRAYWHDALLAVESYSNSAYGGDFEDLSPANQTAVLTDMYNNKPTNFSSIVPQDFFYELFFMTWCGFLMDPMYGGNKNMVGWLLTGFNGTNQGNFYGEGYTTKQIMLMTTPPVLKPASLGQYQKGSA